MTAQPPRRYGTASRQAKPQPHPPSAPRHSTSPARPNQPPDNLAETYQGPPSRHHTNTAAPGPETIRGQPPAGALRDREAVTLVEQPGNHGLQRCHGLRPVAAAVVFQDD
jgi:hypothetical protein